MMIDAAKARPTTPKEITQRVRAFCRSISHVHPVYLPFTETDRRYRPGASHINVEHLARTRGGTVHSGWIVWEGAFRDAEHHAAWRDPAGTLVDITPRVDGEETVLFLPDPQRRFDFRSMIGWCNRTDLPGMPYTWRGSPVRTPQGHAVFGPAECALLALLGLDDLIPG